MMEAILQISLTTYESWDLATGNSKTNLCKADTISHKYKCLKYRFESIDV